MKPWVYSFSAIFMVSFALTLSLREASFSSSYECSKMNEYVSVGCFTPYRHLGSFSRKKQVLTYSDLDLKRFGLVQSWLIVSMRLKR